jgi:hypothetical protein
MRWVLKLVCVMVGEQMISRTAKMEMSGTFPHLKRDKTA